MARVANRGTRLGKQSFSFNCPPVSNYLELEIEFFEVSPDVSFSFIVEQQVDDYWSTIGGFKLRHLAQTLWAPIKGRPPSNRLQWRLYEQYLLDSKAWDITGTREIDGRLMKRLAFCHEMRILTDSWVETLQGEQIPMELSYIIDVSFQQRPMPAIMLPQVG